jgi:hypothetical protein
MTFPPPGYDDETIVPQERLKFLLGELEGELGKIQTVFHQYLPGEFHPPQEVTKGFWRLRISAEELGSEYTFLVEKIISDYEHFQEAPDQDTLDQLFSDVKSLQLLLVG